MKEEKKTSQSKDMKGLKNNDNIKKLIIAVLAIILLVSLFMTFKAFTHQKNTEQTEIINKVKEKVTIDYFAVVNPGVLYPQGGRITPDRSIFTQITSDLIVDLKMDIEAEKPVKIEGTSQVILRILAKDTWQRDAVLIAQSPIDFNEKSKSLIDQQININLAQVLSFMDDVEKETLVRPGGYQLQIIPKIKADILNEQGEKISSADNETIIPFDMTSQYLRYAAEEDKKEFINEIEIEDTSVINQSFRVFGADMSQGAAKILFSSLSLILLAVIIYILKNNGSSDEAAEETKLKKKYADQISEVSDETVFEDKNHIILKHLRSLIKISEEKEEPILKMENIDSQTTSYHVVAMNHIYTYKTKL